MPEGYSAIVIAAVSAVLAWIGSLVMYLLGRRRETAELQVTEITVIGKYKELTNELREENYQLHKTLNEEREQHYAEVQELRKRLENKNAST